MPETSLVSLLRLRGPLATADLIAQLGISRPTLSRWINAAGRQIVARGAARRVGYAARRPLRGSTVSIPLYAVDETGMPQRLGELDLIEPAGVAIRWTHPDADVFVWPLEPRMRDGWFDGLPYFMQDMRPQGFLGRHFARQQADALQVPADPTRWSDDDALFALSRNGVDTPGNLILGDASAKIWLDRVSRARCDDTSHEAIADDALLNAYARLADAAMKDPRVGSSAAGKFPKFTALRFRSGRGAEDAMHTIVKFSGNDGSAGSRRWADLLVCESLAAGVVASRLGVAATISRILIAAGRTFLEVERFDRQGLFGRSPSISWYAISHGLAGLVAGAWPQATRVLVEQNWLPESAWRQIRRVWHFGKLIANTDMHEGNLSFIPERVRSRSGFKLAPIYDMLPMAYAPARGVEQPEVVFSPTLPLPQEASDWHDAAQAAIEFWEACAGDARISDAFRAICAANAQGIRRLV